MKTLFAATLLATTLTGIGFASAMSPAPVSPSNGDVIQVAQGCGPGFARGPYGGCRRIAGWGRPAPVYGAPVVRRCRYWGPGRRVCRTWW